jgi:hypothetical protein
MSVDLPKAGASSGGSHDLGHSAGAERAMRRLDPDEYRPAMGARRTAAVKVHSHRFTDVRGQWETFDTVCFTTHNDLAGSPIDWSASLATSTARKPRRTNMHRIAKSRQPFRVPLSQDARRRWTWSGSNPLGSPANRRQATDGTAQASDRSISPST